MMEQNRVTTIFGTDGGIVALDSPVKLQLLDILHILKKGTKIPLPLNFMF